MSKPVKKTYYDDSVKRGMHAASNRGAADQSAPGDSIGAAESHGQPGSVSEESRSQELEEAAALFSMPSADGSQDGDPPTMPTPSSKRLVPERTGLCIR